MGRKDRHTDKNDSCGANGIAISRRVAVGASALALFGFLTPSAHAQEEINQEAMKKSLEEGRQRVQEIMRQGAEAKRKEMLDKMDPQQRAFWEQMHNADSVEGQMRITQEWHIQQSLVKFRQDLAITDEEWTVVQPRLAAVLRLQQAPYGGGGTAVAASVAQKAAELQALLGNKEVKSEEIKAGLTALRAEKEKARQELISAQRALRKLMTLRQEAVLVLSGLLD